MDINKLTFQERLNLFSGNKAHTNSGENSTRKKSVYHLNENIQVDLKAKEIPAYKEFKKLFTEAFKEIVNKCQEEMEKILQKKSEQLSHKEMDDPSIGWKQSLMKGLIDTGYFTDAMILSPIGGLWATTNETFVISDEDELKKLMTLFNNKGKCVDTCECTTKGVDIMNTNFKFQGFYEDLDVLVLDKLHFYKSDYVCIIAYKGDYFDPIRKLNEYGSGITEYLSSL